MIRPPPIPTLFPYTTLFRSLHTPSEQARHGGHAPLPPEYAAGCGCRVWLPELPQSHGYPALPVLRQSRTVLLPCALIPCPGDRKSTRLNSSHVRISYAVFCL